MLVILLAIYTLFIDQATPALAPAGAYAEDVAATFPLGVFEDANMLGGDPATFDAMIVDLQSRGMDSVMLTNGQLSRDAALLDVSDRRGFGVYLLPGYELERNWWPESIPADIETARLVAEPIVATLGGHPSLRGYVIADEPSRARKDKVALLTQALREFDPNRPIMPILIGIDRVGPIFAAAQPDVMLIDVYPTTYHNPIGDFTLHGFGYHWLEFVDYVRSVNGGKPPTTPLWFILQTHSFGDGGRFSLRMPTPEEVRLQQWLAVGEGAKGLFWFVYSSQQGWLGLADNPALFDEVTALSIRMRRLRDALLHTYKHADRFVVEGSRRTYISTLANAEGGLYAIAANRDCQQPQELIIRAPDLSGHLRDVETGYIYALNTPILFPPGDGKVLELVSG
jgi:hypothetical protein